MATLNLPDGELVRVWRVVKGRVRDDRVLNDAGVRLVFLDGDPESLRTLETYGAPALRFTPRLGAAAWFDEASTGTALVVLVEAWLPLPDAEDLMNLQSALRAAVSSLDDTGYQYELVEAGATTGLTLFAAPLNPAAGRAGENTSYRATGSFTVDVREPLI